jgi:hypothetical protein
MIMKHFLLLQLFLLLAFGAFSQPLETVFLSGTIDADPDFIDIIIEVRVEEEAVQAYLYIPDQFVYAMKSTETYYDGDSLQFGFKKMSAVYTGLRQTGTDTFNGTWKQGKPEFVTNLTVVGDDEIAFLKRPQMPEYPLPYIEKDYFIENEKGKCTLAGTLTIPDTIGVYPLVVLVTGSGAQDRNEEIAGHKPFMIIADYLTRNGIAVFRYDDRGVYKSTGDITKSTTLDFAGDALSVVQYFENHPNINSSLIGVAGHSEGGIIAMMLAAKYPKNIDFIISLAGPGVSSKVLLAKQMEDISRAAGISEEDIKILNEMQLKAMAIAEKSMDMVELRKEITVLYDEYGAKFTEDQRNEYRINAQGINTAILQFSSPWIKYFLTIEPEKYLKKIKCPVLAINGTKDIQVSSKENLAAIEKSLSEGKCKNFTVLELDGLNHLFQQCETGQVQEYYQIQETISIEVLPTLVAFINSCRK